MQIGSFVWRFFNYGPTPALNYVKERFSNNDLSKLSSKNLIDSCQGLDRVLKLSPGTTENFQKNVIQEMRNYEREFRAHFPNFKGKNVFGEHLSINRLLLIRVLIDSQNIQTFIETGTQFGLSAYIAGNSTNLKSLSKILSLDVVKNTYLTHPNVNYVLLNFPIRKSFNRVIKNESENSKILFFHDSDHSLENMSHEFEYTWKFSNVECLISDDVEFNSAFHLFCKKMNLFPHFFKIDSGPTVGFVLK